MTDKLKITIPVRNPIKFCTVCGNDFYAHNPSALTCGKIACIKTLRNKYARERARKTSISYRINHEPEMRNQAIRAYAKAGATLQTLADRFGLSEGEVKDVLEN